MFLNDINDAMQSGGDIGVNLYEWVLTIWLFADDMALLSESRIGLQNGLNSLSSYCDKWGLEVNIEKNKMHCL